jgi:very-short-patch-repair endonuclease
VPVRQHRVHDATGTEVARLDVAWPQSQVALEYDSRTHHGPRRIEHDETRWARVEALGWTILPVTRLDLRPGEVRLRDRLTTMLRPAA